MHASLIGGGSLLPRMCDASTVDCGAKSVNIRGGVKDVSHTWGAVTVSADGMTDAHTSARVLVGQSRPNLCVDSRGWSSRGALSTVSWFEGLWVDIGVSPPLGRRKRGLGGTVRLGNVHGCWQRISHGSDAVWIAE